MLGLAAPLGRVEPERQLRLPCFGRALQLLEGPELVDHRHVVRRQLDRRKLADPAAEPLKHRDRALFEHVFDSRRGHRQGREGHADLGRTRIPGTN